MILGSLSANALKYMTRKLKNMVRGSKTLRFRQR